MKPQEYFDKTVDHLWDNKKSIDLDGQNDVDKVLCQYLTVDGRKCAIGVHIPDGHEGQRFQGAVSSLVSTYPDLKEHVLPEPDGEDWYIEKCLDLAIDLQRVHDAVSRDTFTDRPKKHDFNFSVKNVAWEYGLQYIEK